MSELLLPFGILIVCAALAWGKVHLSGRRCRIEKDLTGKVAIITGGNAGIGKETALGLARRNTTVILACRDPKKSLIEVENIKKETENQNVFFMKLDLSELESIKEFAKNFKAQYKRLDILINNAGSIGVLKRETTKDGFESLIGVNHLGHFYLTNLLLDVIKQTPESRVVNVSSVAHKMGKIHWDNMMLEKGYDQLSGYSQSKLANVLFTKELQRRFYEEDVKAKAVVLHPGCVRTEIYRNIIGVWYIGIIYGLLIPIFWYFFRTCEEGAQTSLQCALEDFDKLKGGSFYESSRVANAGKNVKMEDAKRLWLESEKLIFEKVGKAW